MTWQDRVRALMEKSRYTSIAEVAGAAGVSQGSLNMAMNGKHTPRSSTMDKIAKVLGTTSQFILYGEQKSPSQTVPLLNTDSIGLWMLKQVKLEDCNIITAPGDIGDQGFAWVCDVVDMSPAFPTGSIVFFEPVLSTAISPVRKNYVMAAMVHRDRDKAGIKTGQSDPLGNLFNRTINITSPVFREVVNTSNGIYLVPIDKSFDKIPLDPMDIIARAKYCLINV